MIPLLLFSCASVTDRPSIIVDPNGSFWDVPWPSENRLVEGRPDFHNFPSRGENPLLDPFIDLASTLDGFGTNTPIFVRFDDEIDLSKLPSIEESIGPSSQVVLINIDPQSSEWGELTPVHWNFQADATTWQPDNFLSVAPIWGFPLLPATRYALVIRNGLAEEHPDFPDVFSSDHSRFDEFYDLREAIKTQCYQPDTISFATQFTTQIPQKDLARIHQMISEEISLPPLDQELTYQMRGLGANFYDGHMLIPNWQQGEKPYSSEGGYFAYDGEGRPKISEWEYTAFRLSLPDGPQPVSGWPIVVYSHGTGGDYSTFANSANAFEPANLFAAIGAVGIGISQPLHGDRNPGEDQTLSELWSFNYLNPPAGRTMFRQGAADQMYLTEVLSSHTHTFETDDGQSIVLNPNLISYVGHSHGGEVGALAVPFMANRIQSAVLSGTGGGLSLTLMYRDSGDFDIDTLIRTALQFEDDEIISEFHPIIGLVQMTAEATDPINYAPYWNTKQGWWSHRSLNILTTEGLDDVYTPPISSEALSAAARVPILAPSYQTLPAHELMNSYDVATPVYGNLKGFDGKLVTVGHSQYPDDGHFAIFNNSDAALRYQSFLSETIAMDTPSIK